MSIKVYLHVELEGYPAQTSKIQIPKSWLEKNVSDIVSLFLPGYLKKHPHVDLEVSSVHLATSEGDKIYSNAKVSDVLEDRADYYVKPGKYERASAAHSSSSAEAAGLLRCKNYGCQAFFREEENHEEACRHHVSPPIFHDTMKCWSCCRDRKAYDFESFQQIQGCTLGRHSTEVKKVAIAPSPNATNESGAAASASAAAAPPALKSISEFNASNPDAVSAAASAVQTISTRKSSRNADGTARCQRKGCQKVFVVAENVGECCTFHRGQPVFHDVAKFWSCCPQTKCYDFDEFLKVKGCATGLHDDGVIDLE